MQYISGWQALNIQSESGHIADWHCDVYFKDFKPTEVYEYDENSPLKMLGIKKRFCLLNDLIEILLIMSVFLLCLR